MVWLTQVLSSSLFLHLSLLILYLRIGFWPIFLFFVNTHRHEGESLTVYISVLVDIVSSSVTDSPPQERDSQAISGPAGNRDKGLQQADCFKTADLAVEPVSTETKCGLNALADVPNSAVCNHSSVKEYEIKDTSEMHGIQSKEISDSPDATSNTQERQVDVDTSQVI